MLIITFLNSGLILPQQKIYKRNITPQINSKLKLQLNQISKSIRKNKRLDPGTLNKWKQVVNDLQSSNPSINVDNLVQSVLKESYDEMKEDLAYHKDKVKYFNKVKSEIRNYNRDLRRSFRQGIAKPLIKTGVPKVLLKLKDFSPALKFTRESVKNVKFSKSSRLKFKSLKSNFIRSSSYLNQEQLEEEIKKWEDALETMGDDAQLAKIDLQNMLQKQQQTMQILSNLYKLLHDTALAENRNLL